MGIRDSELGTCVSTLSQSVCVVCRFVLTQRSLTSLRLLSGHHGGAGKGQKEPRRVRGGFRRNPGRLRLPGRVCFRRLGCHRRRQGRAGVTAETNGSERPVCVCVCVTPTTVSTTRKTQHYRHEFVFIPVYTPLVFNLECTLFWETLSLMPVNGRRRRRRL